MVSHVKPDGDTLGAGLALGLALEKLGKRVLYFQEGVVHFFPSGDSLAMAKAMLDVANDRCLRESLIARGYEYVERNGWDRKKGEYLNLIDSLATENFPGAPLISRPASAL